VVFKWFQEIQLAIFNFLIVAPPRVQVSGPMHGPVSGTLLEGSMRRTLQAKRTLFAQVFRCGPSNLQ
jgi:hypothetical protein